MKILGLDLGVGSVGWCLINADEEKNPIEILGIGSRILSLTPDETSYFERGRGKTICAERTARRTARKSYGRRKMRRNHLTSLLASLGMYNLSDSKNLSNLPPLQLWKLRADAATPGCRLTLAELGRVLLHLNKKRGYRHAKSDGSDSKQTQYVEDVNRRFADIKSLGLTVGQYHYSKLKESLDNNSEANLTTYRVKDYVLPRRAYQDEFDSIMQVQASLHPDILIPDVISELRETIFYQRPLKSCKHLVGFCEFERKLFKNKNGKTVDSGPKVAPRTSPISELTRIYEVVNNIRLINSKNRGNKSKFADQPSLFDDYPIPRTARLMQYEYELDDEERNKIVKFLNTHLRMTASDLLKILGLKKTDGFVPDKAIGKGIKGNETLVKISEALSGTPNIEELTRFNVELADSNMVDTDTGEVIQVVSPDLINEPLYRLWHTLYSIFDRDELAGVLQDKFGITNPESIEKLCSLDLVTPGFSNRSTKFMRKLLPHLMKGFLYSEACSIVGVNHSDSLTTEENENRELLNQLLPLAKNSLRQPLVEKILNQMINVVNALIERYGEIDEVRVELARELKQSKDERIKVSQAISKREADNKNIASIIEKYGLRPSRNRIQKYRMWEETGHTCMYCGQPVGATEFLESNGVEVEHIIPRSMYFDDSFANKTCSCRICNQAKNNQTAFDFMKGRDEESFARYQERVDRMFAEGKISKRKHSYLLMSQSEVPTDFIDRDLRQSQYIAKKAREILRTAIRNVWASSGTVTDFFRHAWGYDQIIHNLDLPRYEMANLVEEEEYEHKGQIHIRRRIIGWNKRMDHRHHAIDALTIALTRQGYIQRLNNLSGEHGNIFDEVVNSNSEFKRQHSLLTQWAESRPHFPVGIVSHAVESISISFKSGKKLTTPAKRRVKIGGKRQIVQTDLLVPRGELHKETIYGKINLTEIVPLKAAFQNPQIIASRRMRELVINRIETFGGNVKMAFASTKKEPLTVLKNGKPVTVEKVRCFRPVFVVKKPLDSIRLKDLDSIIDKGIKEIIKIRYEECGNNEALFKKSLVDRPLMAVDGYSIIKSVRLATDLKESGLIAIRKDKSGKAIGFAQSQNNHHVSLYNDINGGVHAVPTTFWDALRRKMYGIPIFVKDAQAAWDKLQDIPDEDVREELALSLPDQNWKFMESMQMNEMFILGLSEDEFNDAVSSKDLATLNNHLYRVQNLSSGDYLFRLHTATGTERTSETRTMKELYRVSDSSLMDLHPHKVRINVIGEIIL